MATYVIDIDGVLTTGEKFIHYTDEEIMAQEPNIEMIKKVNKVSLSNIIILHTSRHWADYNATKKWLNKYGVVYDTLVMGKPLGNYYVDDKNMMMEAFLND